METKREEKIQPIKGHFTFLFIYFLCWVITDRGSRFGSFLFFVGIFLNMSYCVCIKRSPLSFVDRNTRRHTRLNIDHLNHFLLLSRDGCCTHTNTHEMNETAVVVTQWVPQPAAWRLIRRVHLSRNEIKNRKKSNLTCQLRMPWLSKSWWFSFIKCWTWRKCWTTCPTTELTKLKMRWGRVAYMEKVYLLFLF